MNDKAMLRAVLAWGIPFAVVAAALGYETDWGRDVTPDRPVPAKVGPSPVGVALLPEYGISGGIDARRETVERSLFNPTRRPAPPATQMAQAPTQAQHGQYTLTGTTVVGNEATAFLREVKGGKSHTVRKGETLNGIIAVVEVTPEVVKLKQGNDVEELRLKIASGPKSTVQIAPPAPPAQPVTGNVQGSPGVAHPVPGVPTTGSTQALPNAVRPVAPPPTPNASGSAGVVSVGELLAQRRRAAAQAAAEGRTLPSHQ